ncbi:hypothetical protein BY996DRAFT_6570104 [Phakopsora pachyrhizi]|nr:hypothetical protein BY996DRAFT_6570104 [Phakopsora pachyrhizi]
MPRPQKNPSGHLTTEDYSIICMWLSKPSNFSACFDLQLQRENGYALMAAEVNRKSKSGLNISSKQMKERFKNYKAKYVKAKKMSDSTGFGDSEDDQSKGIITISQKLNNLCPCFEQMDNSIETITMVDELIDEEQKKWHLEKEQKDKEQHMELTIREKEIQFAKDGKDNELEVRMLIAGKDCETMKLKEYNALILAAVGSSRSIEEITEISKILFNR